MLNDSQLRILARLSEFGTEVEKAWDVPRALSLPGLAESLGVVRSAVHAPLSGLMDAGLVTTRSAHVIGGGSRRRTVVHITQAGREKVAGMDTPTVSRQGRVWGELPEESILHGRKDQVGNFVISLTNGEKVFLTGLPGVGKTSLARAVIEEILASGFNVRWASCDADSDIASIAAQWFGEGAPRSLAGIIAAASRSRTILVLDEVQELHERHAGGVAELLRSLVEGDSAVLAITRAPNPLGEIAGFEEIRLTGISTAAGARLLPSELEEKEAEQIVTALGGHPLALHLWTPEDKLPAQAAAVTDYVESTVLRRLGDEGIKTLDELCLSPIPLESEELFHPDGIEELDASAILRWFEKRVESHHLIRNVRLGSMSEQELANSHVKAAEDWSKREGGRALRIEAHHRLNSGTLDSDWLAERVDVLAQSNSAATAIIIEDAIAREDDDNLRKAAVDLALERGESNIAQNHLENLPDSPQKKLREARLARMRGDSRLAEELEQEGAAELPAPERVRFVVSSLVRKFDDRLPGSLSPSLAKEIEAGIEAVEISNVSNRDRDTASLSLAILRHSLALQMNDLSSAARARTDIETLLGPDHPILSPLDLRAGLAIRNEGQVTKESLESARIFAEETLDLAQRITLIHAMLEATSDEIPAWLAQMHTAVFSLPLRDDLASHRRLSAQMWYWRGIIESQNRLSHWQEAIHRFRAAECSQAAAELLSKLTRSL